MNIFCLTFGAAVAQAEVVSLLQNQKAQHIQTSSGLCVKTEQTESVLRGWLEKWPGVTVAKVEAGEAGAISPDVKAFVEA